jgi:hypothetical protein
MGYKSIKNEELKIMVDNCAKSTYIMLLMIMVIIINNRE